eukprot:scaffold652238_cov55-Prasinocladus_malaysianus.AAC.1
MHSHRTIVTATATCVTTLLLNTGMDCGSQILQAMAAGGGCQPQEYMPKNYSRNCDRREICSH